MRVELRIYLKEALFLLGVKEENIRNEDFYFLDVEVFFCLKEVAENLFELKFRTERLQKVPASCWIFR